MYSGVGTHYLTGEGASDSLHEGLIDNNMAGGDCIPSTYDHGEDMIGGGDCVPSTYYSYCYVALLLFVIFIVVGWILLKVSLIKSVALGAVASFCYLNTLELPSKVTDRDKATIHIIYLLNVIIIVAYVLYSILISSY